MRGFGVVFTLSVVYNKIAIALMLATTKKIATTKTVAIPRKKSLLMDSTRSLLASCQANG